MKVLESYADFLETIPDGAIVVDKTGSIVMANKRAHRILATRKMASGVSLCIF